MRLELRRDGDATVFAFLVYGDQPPGPAGGWHAGIDALEMYTTGKQFDLGAPLDEKGRPPAGSYLQQLMSFYVGYLADHASWATHMRSRAGPREPGEAAKVTAAPEDGVPGNGEQTASASDEDLDTPVGKALVALTDALSSEDIEAVLSVFSDTYSDAGGITKASLRPYFEGLFEQGIFRGAKIRIERVTAQGDTATSTIVYNTMAGSARYEYELARVGDSWLILRRRPI